MGLDLGGLISGGISGLASGNIWGAAAGALLGSGVLGGGTQGATQTPQQAQQAVDPFAQYRAQYATQLNTLMTNPSSVQNDPGFAAAMKQGQGQVQQTMAATGQGVSGAEQMALQNQAMTQQNQYYQQDLSNLEVLSGANANPAAGGNAAINATNASQTQAGSTVGALFSGGANSAFNSASSYISGLFGSGTNPGQSTATNAASTAGAGASTQPSNYGSVATGYGV